MSFTRILDDATNKNSKENQSKKTSWLWRLFSRKEVRLIAITVSVLNIVWKINTTGQGWFWCLLNWQRRKLSPGQEPTSKSTNLKSGSRIGYLRRIFAGSNKAKVHAQPSGAGSELAAPTMTTDCESEGIKKIEIKVPSSIPPPLYKAIHDTKQQPLLSTVYQDAR